MWKKRKPRMSGSRHQALQNTHTAEKVDNHVHVSHRSVIAFERKARRIITLYGDTEEAQVRIRRLEAVRPDVAAAIAQRKWPRRYHYGSSGQASAPRLYRDKWIARLRLIKPTAPIINTAQITADMEAVRTILQHLVKPEAVDRWFNKNIPLLDNRTPADMIRQGRTEQVIEVLARVEEGIHL